MNVQTIDFRGATAERDFIRSLRETGFAILQNHPIEKAFLNQLYDDWAAFFASEQKHDFLFSDYPTDRTRAGFFPMEVSETAVTHSTKDLKEFYQIVTDGPLPPACAERILEYRKQSFALGVELLDWLQRGTPGSILEHLGGSVPEMINLDASMLRILHYPPLAGVEEVDAVRAAEHEDINTITILPVADQPGLQVKDNTGNWLDVSGKCGDIVINTGDMLQEATDGYYPSTTHRVVNPDENISNDSRVSIPHFLSPRFDVRLSDRYTAGSYLDERLKLIHR